MTPANAERYDYLLWELQLPVRKRARRVAHLAHTLHIESRRGTFEDDRSGFLELHDNNPYNLREREIRMLAAWLTARAYRMSSARKMVMTPGIPSVLS